jgi:hypothetical protein
MEGGPMWLILIMSSIFVDQSRIDEATDLLRHNYNEQIFQAQQAVVDDIIPAAPRLLREYTPNISMRGDLVIGDTPAETLSVTGYFYNEGDITIINDGVLKVKNSDFNLDGDIIIANEGVAIIDSSEVNIVQHYIYHHILFVTDSAYFSMTNSQTAFNNYQITFIIAGNAGINMNNVTNQDWITAVVQQTATAILKNIDGYTGEWLFASDCYAQFKNVDHLLTWYFFPGASVVDFDFPEDDTIYGFYIDSTLTNVSGIGYHVEIDSSTDCMWATIPLRGSDVTIRNSELRVTGLMFEGSDTFAIAGLVNGLDYSDWVLPVTDRNYRLINSAVQTWNLYPDNSTNINLSSSIFGELCGFGGSHTLIQNAFCDGTGGHIEASNNSSVFVLSSSIFADVITKNRGICLLGNCAMPVGRIWVTGASIMLIINTVFPEDPIPSDTSIVFVASITAPSSGHTEDSIGIIGSAWIDKGPYQPLDFGHYRLYFRKVGDPFWTPFSDTKYQEVRRDTLDYWNTTGLTDGTYELKLVLKDNAGDSVETEKQIRLDLPAGIDEEPIKKSYVSIKQVDSRLLLIETSPDINEFDIYNLSGRLIERIKSNKTCWLAPASGVYYLKNSEKGICKKIVVY